MRLFLCVSVAVALGGCSAASLSRLASNSAPAQKSQVSLAVEPASAAPRVAAAELDGLIARYAAINNIPPALIHRIIQRESGYNPRARNGPYWGLMQIRHDTAMSMGYRGPASGLLDAETNLMYGVRYLAGAYLVANRNSDQAMRNYARGYYYDAKRLGLLEETGLN